MKKLFGILAVSVLLGTVGAWAGDGCCAGAAGPHVNFTAGNDCFAKLNLTADQKSKVNALFADCKTVGCSAAAREKMTTGLKAILTAEQYTQWTAVCEQAKAASGGKCPFAAKAKAE